MSQTIKVQCPRCGRVCIHEFTRELRDCISKEKLHILECSECCYESFISNDAYLVIRRAFLND